VLSGTYAFVADGGSGLCVINVSDPVNPTLAGFYHTPGSAHGIAVDGNLVYIADSADIGIYDCSAALGASDSFIPHPSSFILSCYPNPFNSTTTLQLDLPRDIRARLVVYDVLGREVSVLNDGLMSAGSHVVRFDANKLSSGNYFVRLDAANASQIQKLILVK
jgi:DNA-binding beta-propeller fold protein YncE